MVLEISATPYIFRPSPSDLYDLAHQNAYTWGISYSNSNLGALENELAHGYRIGSAVLSINGIYDWGWTKADLDQANRQVLRTELEFNRRAGFTAADCCAGSAGISAVACYVSPPCGCPEGTTSGGVQGNGTTMCNCP